MPRQQPVEQPQPDLSRSEAFVEDLEDAVGEPSPLTSRSFHPSTVALLSIAPFSMAVLGAVFGVGP